MKPADQCTVAKKNTNSQMKTNIDVEIRFGKQLLDLVEGGGQYSSPSIKFRVPTDMTLV